MVNEYGARSYTVANGVVYFSNNSDRRVYRQRPGEAPVPMTAETGFRYGSRVVDQRRGRIVCTRENHTDLDMKGLWEPQILLADNDFHSSPCLSPGGKLLAWLYWDHPNMPRDGTELCTAPFHADGSLGEATFIAGGVEQAVIQPERYR